MELVINEDSLHVDEIQEFNSKVRAILIDENNKILVANYHNMFLLPGGKVDGDETIFEAITRELKEELGQNYNSDELDFFLTLKYYQKNYPKTDGTYKNRLVETHYFIGNYKGVSISKQILTEREQRGNFKLELVSLDNLENIILNNKNDNLRNVYFQKELLTIIESYKKNINHKKL